MKRAKKTAKKAPVRVREPKRDVVHIGFDHDTGSSIKIAIPDGEVANLAVDALKSTQGLKAVQFARQLGFRLSLRLTSKDDENG
jgi:hypothetical protein